MIGSRRASPPVGSSRWRGYRHPRSRRDPFLPLATGSFQVANAKLYSNDSYDYTSYVDEVAVLNPATGAETTKIPAVLNVAVFSTDSQHLNGVGLGGVGVIDTATDVSATAVANIPGATGLAITPDGKHLYITDVATGSILVADTATYTISTILPVALAGNGAIAIVSAD
jgi:YVTN family beta-propeller protein